jgi:glucose-6-phosphate 1-epimerase
MNLQELNARFGLEGAARFERGEGGLTRLAVATEGAEAQLYLHGAHLASYRPAGEKPLLWLSNRSWFGADKPIRGGVPLCFPWFGRHPENPALPAHGFARLCEWEVGSVRRLASGVEVALCFHDDEWSRTLWPHTFALLYTVTVTAHLLTMCLAVTNRGTAPFRFTEALHSYFAVGDVRRIMVLGLEGGRYTDTAGGGRVEKTQDAGPISFSAETDRIYHATATTCTIDDPVWERKIRVEKRGSGTTVVWNPWIEKARKMEDYGDDEWPRMVCVETANAEESAVTLAPGITHGMEASLNVTR